MASTGTLVVRDTRDRLIDLLKFGKTYPLCDVLAADVELVVAFGLNAQFLLEYSQSDVSYQLYLRTIGADGKIEQESSASDAVDGNGGKITLLTKDPIQEDTTFWIKATKKKPNGQSAYLLHKATAKVGLDTSLNAVIIGGDILDPALREAPPNDAARVFAYGMRNIPVQVFNSQEGVTYRLVRIAKGREKKISSGDEVPGTLHEIMLSITSVTEDVDVRIRATRTFAAGENRDPQTTLLDIVLPLKVRADTRLSVAAALPIMDFNTTATMTIAKSESDVSYQLFAHTVRDREFVHETNPTVPVVTVSVGGREPDAHLVQPPTSVNELPPAGYLSVGVAQVGNGDTLTFTTGELTDDSLFIVQAQKNHQGAKVLPSYAQLDQAVAVLVRPNTVPEIVLRTPVINGKLGTEMRVSHGQAGVFYYLRHDPSKDDFGYPAYFHKHDDDDLTANKGLDQLGIEIDFVVARSHPEHAGTPVVPRPVPIRPPIGRLPPAGLGVPLPPIVVPPISLPSKGADLAHLAPETLLLTIPPLDADVELTVFAIKAQSRVSAFVQGSAQFHLNPNIHPAATSIPVGAKALILLPNTRTDETYQLNPNANPPGASITGDGQDMTLETDPLQTDTIIELLVRRIGEGIIVEYLFSFSIQVR